MQRGGSGRDTASILHIDMDSFFVSVELLDAPHLSGKAVVVGGDGPRGVVASASYEARKFGVRSAMPTARAKQLAPHLIVIPPTFAKYSSFSRTIMEIFGEFTPLVEQLSIDEAFLDVRGSQKLFGEPIEIAHSIRQRVREATGLPASVGLASTKFVAKLASQRAKPDGVCEIPPEETLSFLHALPIEAMWGVGAVTGQKLASRAIRTIGDLAQETPESLRNIVGNAAAQKLYDLAHGRDPREVETRSIEKSIGQETTFTADLYDVEDIERELLRLAEGVAARLRKQQLSGRTIALKYRFTNFDTVTRSRTIDEPTNSGRRIYLVAKELLTLIPPSRQGVRLIGVRAEQLVHDDEIMTGLWSDDEKYRQLDEVIDETASKFGSLKVQPARLISKEPKESP